MKAVQAPVILVSAQSLGASFTSSTINVIETDVLGLQLNYTGSPVGTLEVQASQDNVNFATLPLSVAGTLVTSLTLPTDPSPLLLDIVSGSLSYVRVVYTRTSGSGSITIYTSKKRLGD